MSESGTAASVSRVTAATMCLCGVFPCRVRLPLFCVMVLVIDALEHDRESQAGGLTGANTEITHPAAACLVFVCGAAAGQQPGISARTVSPLDATVHRNRLASS